MAKYKVLLEAEIDGEADVLGAVEQTMMIARSFANDGEIFGNANPPHDHWVSEYTEPTEKARIEVTKVA